MDDALNFGNREEWRSWLAENFDKQKYAWLLLCKKGVDMKGMSLEETVEEAICFGWIDGKLRRIDEKRFILRFSPRKLKSIWSKINKERAERLIATGKMTEAGLATVEAAKKSGAWESAYTSRVAGPLPEDLEEPLMKGDVARANFQRFSNSYTNMCIAWINTSKTSETRTRRIRKVVEQSRQHSKLT